MFGGEVVDREQDIDVVGDLRGGLAELRPVGGIEGGDGGQGVPLVLGVPDLREGLLRPGMRRGRQGGEDVADLVGL